MSVVPPFSILDANILGHFADISLIPHDIEPNPFGREGNHYMAKFKGKIIDIGPSTLIIEFKEGDDGKFKWVEAPQSSIQDRQDLIEAMGKLIDEYYESIS